MQITVQVVPLMTDEDLVKIGVTSLGDRVVLKNVCKNMQRKLHVVQCAYYYYIFLQQSYGM